ncbi:glycosyltransferase [Sphingomonas aquatica]|uniref:glycosyltransferase n=1 Tax=Sphingomonas aquatica TaxID=1763824 RepID=UPI0008325DC5|nr:poly-beta-1,6 N-acetyl-D-glucosamine synthase [Sphingobium sp.]
MIVGDAAAIIFLSGHYLIMMMLGVLGAHRLYLTYLQWRSPAQRPTQWRFDDLPRVTVQLPVFNERLVIARLIDAAVALDYPRDQIEIQILDDSTDETTAIAAARADYHRARGIRIEHIIRPDRRGFKAGALAYGLERANGEFLLILDADFVPAPDFLRALIDPLADPGVAMVQARWAYLNRESNLITRAQAVLLDAHFAIEQSRRAARNLFFNFNGTAGIWRKQAISDAGGWRADTLTEDLDLSYRAQLAGWRFVYRGEVICRSELPADMNAFKTQQHRWTKGSIEVMLRLIPAIWRAKLPLRVKVEATVHLTSNLSYLFILLECLVLFGPGVAFREAYHLDALLWIDAPLFALASLSHLSFFLFGQRVLGIGMRARLREIAFLIPMLIGLALNNGRAVVEALLGVRSDFVRTPKHGGIGKAVVVRANAAYRAARSHLGEWTEIGLGVAFAIGGIWLIQQQYWLSAPFAILFAFSFLSIGASTIQARLPRRLATA